MSGCAYPKHLQSHLNLIKRDITNVEEQINYLFKCERANSKPWRANSEFAKSKSAKKVIAGQTKTTQKLKENNSKPALSKPLSGNPTSKKEVSRQQSDNSKQNEKLCGCCQIALPVPSYGKVSTHICSKNHVHHTIKIPTSTMRHEKQKLNDCQTWRDVLQQSTGREEAKLKTEESARNFRNQKIVEMMQKEVREALEAKAQAERDAVVANSAVAKLKTMLQAKAQIDSGRKRALELIAVRIEDLRTQKQEVIHQTLHDLPSVNSPTSSHDGSKSQPFKASSPTRSDKSLTASEASWHDFSRIDSQSFATI